MIPGHNPPNQLLTITAQKKKGVGVYFIADPNPNVTISAALTDITAAA
jgi:hypothetical protein